MFSKTNKNQQCMHVCNDEILVYKSVNKTAPHTKTESLFALCLFFVYFLEQK